MSWTIKEKDEISFNVTFLIKMKIFMKNLFIPLRTTWCFYSRKNWCSKLAKHIKGTKRVKYQSQHSKIMWWEKNKFKIEESKTKVVTFCHSLFITRRRACSIFMIQMFIPLCKYSIHMKHTHLYIWKVNQQIQTLKQIISFIKKKWKKKKGF